MKRKLVAILAADVCGYSRLVADDEERTLSRLLADRQAFDAIAARWAGRVFNTAGDAVLAEFGSAVDALRAAVAIQEEVGRRGASEPATRRMRYRIGVTIGDVVEEDGDLLGDGVNVASRLEALAEPGGICLSRGVHEQIRGKLPCRMRDIGPQRLKNMPVPVHAYLIAADDLVPGAAARAKRRPRARAASVAIAVFAFAAVGATVASRRAGPVRRADAAAAPAAEAPPQTFVFGPDPQLPVAAEAHRPFALDAVPFVGEAARADIGRQLAQSPGGALALTRSGTFGVGADGGDAVRVCFNAGGTNCRLYAAGGEVVWPEPLPPLPPKPWVDPSAVRTPFDVRRIAGLSDGERRRIAENYPDAADHKAFALGPRRAWTFRSNKATVEEAERVALETCGEYSGTPCRIVAVDGDFVVPLRAP